MKKWKGDFGFRAGKMPTRVFHAQLRFGGEIRSECIRMGLDLADRSDLTVSLLLTS
jgi:hypothetical protein